MAEEETVGGSGAGAAAASRAKKRRRRGQLRSHEHDANDDAYYAFMVIPCIFNGGMVQALHMEDWGNLLVLGRQPILQAFTTWLTASRLLASQQSSCISSLTSCFGYQSCTHTRTRTLCFADCAEDSP